MTKVMRMLRGTLYTVLVFVTVTLSSFLIAQALLGVSMANVKGESMEPTLSDGDTLLYTRPSDIDRYDIVLGEYINDDDKKTTVVKRVIGLPGDDVAVIKGDLFLNGKRYEEPYVNEKHEDFKEESFRYQLGDKEYFLMGDNRDSSLDSRNNLGVVHKDSIVGVVNIDVNALKGAVLNND